MGVDPALATSITMVESLACWPSKCSRFEPGWRYLLTPEVFAVLNTITVETEIKEQMTSWGPMHVMGSVARELGFRDPLPLLFQPETGIRYGCLKLQRIEKIFESEDAVISAYNAGTPRKLVNGFWANQDYVDAVKTSLKRLRMI